MTKKATHKTPTISTLKDVLADQLQDIYSSETQITKALPKLAEAATSPDLKKGFLKHLEQTEEHVARITAICKELEIDATGKVCEATVGLVKEGTEAIESPATPEMRDLMLIAAARRVEHYEMSAYTSAIDLARTLKLSDVLKTLSHTLKEETATDEILAKATVPALAAAHTAEE